MAFITRAYNSFDIDKNTGLITKKSKSSRLNDETWYYRGIPPKLSHYLPRMINCGKTDDEYYLTLELYKYHNLAHFMLEQPFNGQFWETVGQSLKNALSNFKTFNRSDAGYQNPLPFSTYRSQMFLDKTISEYYKLLEIPFFKELSKKDTISLNGKNIRSFEKIWGDVESKLRSICTDDDFSIIHGDMCFSNILCGGDEEGVVLKFIDPRGSFGENGCYGDPLYDYAKLAHSFDGGYEYFIYDKFIVDQSITGLSFILQYANSTKEQISKVLWSIFPDAERDVINLVQGTIFIGMCARHYDSFDRQKAMYLTGLKTLNDLLE